MKNKKLVSLIILGGAFLGVVVGCSATGYRRQNESLKQENAELKAKNMRLETDCVRLYANNEMLLKKVKEAQSADNSTGKDRLLPDYLQFYRPL